MSDFQKIAFLDFDGTITTKDTLPEIIRFQKGSFSFYAGFFLHAPWLLGYKLKLLPNDKVKEKILKYFFGGMKEQDFQRACDDFAEKKLPSLIRGPALMEIGKLKAARVKIVIVSASADNWIRKWSDSLSLDLIATKLEIKDGLLTGKIEGHNCHGEEKVRRIRASYNLSRYEEIYAFGDTPGDRPMLSLAGKPFYKPFR